MTAADAAKQRYGALLDHHTVQQANRLFMISLRRHYVYCPVSKVANTSIKALLCDAEVRGIGLIRPAAEFDYKKVHDPMYGPLLLPYQLPNTALEAALYTGHFFRFVVVRHPLDRLLSCYLDRVSDETSVASLAVREGLGVDRAEDVTFPAFVDFIATQDALAMNPHWRPIYHEAAFEHVRYDMVLRFEALASDLPALFERLYPKLVPTLDFTTNISPAITNARTRRDEFATPEIAKKVELIYAKDFETFGY